MISPENGEHPFPGAGSFRQGERLLEFFEELGTRRTRRLTVFLSGGASSLAWIRPNGMSAHELHSKLRKLYSEPLTIDRLNRERSKLCLLKSGGATRLLRKKAPRIRVEVFVLSDVAPFGPEVVGSGPFRGLPHHVLASNRDLVTAAGAAGAAATRGREVLKTKHSLLGSEQEWAETLSRQIRHGLGKGRTGLLIWGGEPQVKLPKSSRKRRGGRQSQLAARLLDVFWQEIRDGRVEILCASSDGSDGTSGAAAVHLCSFPLGAPLPRRTASLQRQLKKAIARFDTAPLLRRMGLTIPSFQTGTNLQDLVLVRLAS